MPGKVLVPRIALFILLLTGAAVFGGQPQWAGAFAFAALGAAVWLAMGLAQPRKRDPYDLKLLREVHEQLEIEHEDHIPADASVLCPHCGNVYPSNFPICPNCRRSYQPAQFWEN